MTYNGGKGASGVHQQIINKMPKHRVYIETHLGSGNILRRKKPSECTIAIEVDTAVLENFKEYFIAEDNDTASMACGLVKDSEAISFINGRCEEFLQGYSFKGDEVVYADPPYVFDTRRNKRDLYKHEYDDNDHIKLISILESLPCFVMLSGYESKLYKKHLDLNKWHLFTFNAMTRKGVRVEALWCNFNPDDYFKHDYQYMGENYRERERIQRKAARWVKNLEKLPVDEKNFILSNISESFGLELINHL